MKNLLEELLSSGVFEEQKKQVVTQPIYRKATKKENTVTIDEYNDLAREKEYWRKDALYWEDKAKKWKAAYERLKEKYEGNNESMVRK